MACNEESLVTITTCELPGKVGLLPWLPSPQEAAGAACPMWLPGRKPRWQPPGSPGGKSRAVIT